MGTEVKSPLAQALCEFHLKVGTIHKLTKAQYGLFADLQTVLAAITPALCECGLAVTQIFDGGNLVTMLKHTGGETITSSVPLLAEGGRNALHSWGGAVTYQRRYAILAILNLAAGIEDDDGQSATQSRVQKASTASNDEFF